MRHFFARAPSVLRLDLVSYERVFVGRALKCRRAVYLERFADFNISNETAERDEKFSFRTHPAGGK